MVIFFLLSFLGFKVKLLQTLAIQTKNMIKKGHKLGLSCGEKHIEKKALSKDCLFRVVLHPRNKNN